MMTLWKAFGKDGIFKGKSFIIDLIAQAKKKVNGYGGIVMAKRNMRDFILMIKKMVYGCSGMNLGILKLMDHIIIILNGQAFLRMEDIIRGKWLA